MISSLITSKTRIKLLLKFFLNCQIKSYLRSLESEFGGSTNAIRLELNHLEKNGFLSTSTEGNKKMFFANVNHPLFNDINVLLKKNIGIDQIILQITSQVAGLQAAYLTGDLANGKDSEHIELTLIGNRVNGLNLESLVAKTESLINRKISFIILKKEEMKNHFGKKPVLLIWNPDN